MMSVQRSNVLLLLSCAAVGPIQVGAAAAPLRALSIEAEENAGAAQVPQQPWALAWVAKAETDGIALQTQDLLRWGGGATASASEAAGNLPNDPTPTEDKAPPGSLTSITGGSAVGLQRFGAAFTGAEAAALLEPWPVVGSLADLEKPQSSILLPPLPPSQSGIRSFGASALRGAPALLPPEVAIPTTGGSITGGTSQSLHRFGKNGWSASELVMVREVQWALLLLTAFVALLVNSYMKRASAAKKASNDPLSYAFKARQLGVQHVSAPAPLPKSGTSEDPLGYLFRAKLLEEQRKQKALEEPLEALLKQPLESPRRYTRQQGQQPVAEVAAAYVGDDELGRTYGV